MDTVRSYILSIVAAGMLVCICGSFFEEKSTVGTLTRMIGGLFLSFVILGPVAGWDFDMVETFTQSFESAGEIISASGTDLASDAMADIIKEELSAYILDKAADVRADIGVEVILSNGEMPLPESVKLFGNVSPYAKGRLESIIAKDLGIPKERQLWIG